MKPVRFLGDSLECLRAFPPDARNDAGYQLELVQDGRPAADFKPMPIIGRGVEELRVWVESGTYRVIYLARLANIVVVLHAFQKEVTGDSRERPRPRETPLQGVHERRPMKKPLTFNSLWDALADSPAEAMNLRLRSELMRRITGVIETQGWSQAETARRANVLPPRISDLQRGQLHRFSLDALVNIAAALGCDVRLKLKHVA